MKSLLSVVSFLLSLDFLKDYDNELRIMNNNKIGHPFKITICLIDKLKDLLEL